MMQQNGNINKSAGEIVLDTANQIREEREKLIHENKMLKNRCAALTDGTMCLFCPYECENRSKDFRGHVNDGQRK